MADTSLSPRRLAYLAGVRRQKRRVRIWQLALLIGLFGFWELSCRTGLSDGFLVSCPSRMATTFWSLCRSGQLLHHIGVSCLETVLGFTAGTLLGTAAAILMWWSDTAARILDPYLVVLNALPKTALGPIFIVWMGGHLADRDDPEHVYRLSGHRSGKGAPDAHAGSHTASDPVDAGVSRQLPHPVFHAEGQRGPVVGGRHHG